MRLKVACGPIQGRCLPFHNVVSANYFARWNLCHVGINLPGSPTAGPCYSRSEWVGEPDYKVIATSFSQICSHNKLWQHGNVATGKMSQDICSQGSPVKFTESQSLLDSVDPGSVTQWHMMSHSATSIALGSQVEWKKHYCPQLSPGAAQRVLSQAKVGPFAILAIGFAGRLFAL